MASSIRLGILVAIVAAAASILTSTFLGAPSDPPRTIAPRGELADDEQNTVAIFESASPSGQRTYPAALVGVSPEHDLAVLRIDVAFDKPPPVAIGTSADLKVGQKVFAIGHPFGLDYTLTTGVGSALDRTIDNDRGGVIGVV